MPKKKANYLKVRLEPSNTASVTQDAKKSNTTPPRIVNKIVSEYYDNGK